jgi:hypothetical protein
MRLKAGRYQATRQNINYIRQDHEPKYSKRLTFSFTQFISNLSSRL